MKNRIIKNYSKALPLLYIYKNINFVFFSLIILLSLLGVTLLYSTAMGNFYPWSLKQLETLLLFIPIMIFVSFIRLNLIYKYSYGIYFFGLILLIIAEIMGYKAMGAQRWIRIGPINFQPSELMKIFLILALARYFHDTHSEEIKRTHNLFIPLVLVLIPTILILKQPNLGTALIILAISGALFFTAGVRAWKFILLIGLGLVSLPIIWQFMHDYQKQRVLTFLNPESDPLGAGYNIIQSMISIGSGGYFGKGFTGGTQSQLSFLPEKQTDFIFAVLAEEFGLLGVVITFLICIAIIFYCYTAAWSSNNQFGRLIITGVSTAFAVHIIINTAMIAGIIPVVGTPFPLLSYGGSNLMAFLIGFGLVQNCKINYQANFKK